MSRLPAKGTARRECIDRRVFESLWAEYSHAGNYRGLALLKAIYREAYPAWPEMQEKAKVPAAAP